MPNFFFCPQPLGGECLPCCCVLTTSKVLMCHEDVQTNFVRTLGSANVTDTTAILVDSGAPHYCVLVSVTEVMHHSCQVLLWLYVTPLKCYCGYMSLLSSVTVVIRHSCQVLLRLYVTPLKCYCGYMSLLSSVTVVICHSSQVLLWLYVTPLKCYCGYTSLLSSVTVDICHSSLVLLWLYVTPVKCY